MSIRSNLLACCAVIALSQFASADGINNPGSDEGVPGDGTVTSVSVVTANNLSGTVANPTSTPAITLTLGAGTSSTLGGVKPDGTTITNSSGAISVTYGTAANTAAQGNDSRITGPAAVSGAIKSNGSGTFSQAACADLSNDGALCALGVGAGRASSGGNLVNSATEHVSFQPGLITSVTNTKGAFYKFSKASTVDNLEVSANSFSCVSNPTVTMYECGTSASCGTPTTIGSATVTTAGTVVDGSVSSAAITAGDYVAFAISAGTCATLDIQMTAQAHQN